MHDDLAVLGIDGEALAARERHKHRIGKRWVEVMPQRPLERDGAEVETQVVEADRAGRGRAIAKAADEGLAVVRCYADGTRRIVEARRPATAA